MAKIICVEQSVQISSDCFAVRADCAVNDFVCRVRQSKNFGEWLTPVFVDGFAEMNFVTRDAGAISFNAENLCAADCASRRNGNFVAGQIRTDFGQIMDDTDGPKAAILRAISVRI